VTHAPRVVVFDPIPGWSFAPEAAVLGHRGVELVVPNSERDADECLADADVVVVTGIRRLGADRIRGLTRAAGVLCYSIGMDKVDAAAATAAGIPLRNVPDYCTEEVSDHAMALLLAAERRLVPLAREAAEEWTIRDRTLLEPIRRLRGQTLGVVGAGRIGRLVARKARALGFVTLAHDPALASAPDDALELVSLDDLMRRADAIVLCAALTEGSRGLIGRDALALARAGLIVVNVARGALLDEGALGDALRDGRVGYAALDVRDPEPPDPRSDPLSGLPNVLQTPHVAASSRDAAEDLHRLAAVQILDLLESAGLIPAVA
jgi:phosphoglycerate dehydrogenase-like enzyme